MVEVPVSIGELLDKISILTIKAQHFTGEKKQKAIDELALLSARCKLEWLMSPTYSLLIAHNQYLWDLETDIRAALAEQQMAIVCQQLKFIHEFNAERHRLKTDLDRLFGSGISEQKDYTVKL